MPELSPEEKQALKGSIDFLGLNLYTAYLVEPKTFDVSVVSVESDLGGRQVQDQTWFKGGSSWLAVMPQVDHYLLGPYIDYDRNLGIILRK